MSVARYLRGDAPRANPEPGSSTGPWRVERRPTGTPGAPWAPVFEVEGPLDAAWAEALAPAPGDVRPLDALRVVWGRMTGFSVRHGFVLPDGRAVELPPVASDRTSREVYTHLLGWGADWCGAWEATDRADVLLNSAEVQAFRLGLAPLSLATTDLARLALGFAREAMESGAPPPDGADVALAFVEAVAGEVEAWAEAGGGGELPSPHAFTERFKPAQEALGDGPQREGAARDRFLCVRGALFAARALTMGASGWTQFYLAVSNVRNAAAALGTLRARFARVNPVGAGAAALREFDPQFAAAVRARLPLPAVLVAVAEAAR